MHSCSITKVFFDEELPWQPMQATWPPPNVSVTNNTNLNTSTVCINNDTLNPVQLENDTFVIWVNGVVSPLLVIFTILTNSFICLVLLKPHMRTPTNTLLVAIAITDMTTGVWPLPCYIFFYTLKNCFEWLPYSWCSIYLILTEFLPTISHTSSVWLTVILAFQRYICICHSHTGRRWFSRSNVLKAIVCVHAAAILSHTNRFFEHVFTPVEVTSLLDANVTMTSCYEALVPFVKTYANVYFNVYYWFRVIFIHLVPCASLLILNILLIKTLQSAQQRKVRLMGRQKSDSSPKPSESNSTTLMLVFVVGLFLLVEFPLAILFIIYIVQNTFGLTVIEDLNMLLATHVLNLIILFSYPINFFIYCAMSRKFRETFTRMILLHRRKGSDASSNTQYFSLATEAETRAMHAGQHPDVVAMTGC